MEQDCPRTYKLNINGREVAKLETNREMNPREALMRMLWAALGVQAAKEETCFEEEGQP